MTRDFFEKLTDPRDDWRGLQPGDEDDQSMRDELAPALDVLRDAGPTNGIDLVPRWQAFLSDPRVAADRIANDAGSGMVFAPSTTGDGSADKSSVCADRQRRKRWHWSSIARYAAVLVLGATAGLAMSRSFVGAAAATGQRTCSYTESDRQLMFAVLDDAAPPAPATVRRAAVQLAACVACHEHALRPRFDCLTRQD